MQPASERGHGRHRVAVPAGGIHGLGGHGAAGARRARDEVLPRGAGGWRGFPEGAVLPVAAGPLLPHRRDHGRFGPHLLGAAQRWVRGRQLAHARLTGGSRTLGRGHRAGPRGCPALTRLSNGGVGWGGVVGFLVVPGVGWEGSVSSVWWVR